MGKYNTIAVIYGSDSSEWEVACRSGEFTASRIDDTAYDVYGTGGLQEKELHEGSVP